MENKNKDQKSSFFEKKEEKPVEKKTYSPFPSCYPSDEAQKQDPRGW